MNRLHGLDALRGIAAMLVLVFHILTLLPGNPGWAAAITSTIDLGKLGVAIFFLISGFVIPFSLKRGLAAFGIGRAARLLPALWLSMLFAIALGAKVSGAGQLLANAFMLAELFGQHNLTNPYWTLIWELGFYLIVALVYALGGLKNPRTFGLLSLFVGACSVTHGADSYLIIMFCGTLLRMILLEKNEAAKMWLRASITVLIGIWFLWSLTPEYPPSFYYSMGLAFPVFLLLWNRFSHPVLMWLGSVSYSLYLFHLPIIEALSRAGLPAPAFVAFGIALPLLVAGIVYRWVERPMIALGKNVLPTKRVIRTDQQLDAI